MKLRVVAALAVVSLVAAGFAGATSAGAAPAAPKAGNATGVSATEVKVEALGYKAFYGDSLIGAQARFKRQNDAGGVNGRKITLTTFNDDNQTPATDTQVARKIVEQDKPFAIVPVMTAAFPAAAYLDQQGVPFVGWGIVPDWCKKNAGFSLTGCTDPAIGRTVSDFVPSVAKVFPDGSAKGKAIAIIGADNDSAKISINNFANQWIVDGAKVVYKAGSIPLPPTVVSDYTPYAQAIMSSNGGKGPDLVEAVSSTSDGIGIAKKLRELNYKGKILEFSLYDPRIASSSKDIYNEITFAAWEQTDSPAVAQMIKDVDAIDSKATKGLALEAGYWSADLFISILKKAGKNLTRESFIAAGNKNFKYNGHNGTTNLSFPANHIDGSSGITIVLGTGTGYTVVSPFTNLPVMSKTKFQKQLAAATKAAKKSGK
ncbi:MAG: ABC-type branched-chain amino acid transport system periplasmic component-like protein [Actinomycetia bacterium]|nr:ABC-type branched-chain amino acid transport system periplasmic component-like protein [Actinomycetes bacterium]